MAKKETPPTGKPTKQITISRPLSYDELFQISNEQNRLLQEMDEVENDMKAYSATQKGKIKVMLARRQELTTKFSNKIEYENRLVYVHHDYDAKRIYHIDVIDGDILEDHPMSPTLLEKWLNRQRDIEEETRKKVIAQQSNDGYAFYIPKLVELFDTDMLAQQTVDDVDRRVLSQEYIDELFGKFRYKWPTQLIDSLYSSGKLPTDYNFDEIYDQAAEWFRDTVLSLVPGPFNPETFVITPQQKNEDQQPAEQAVEGETDNQPAADIQSFEAKKAVDSTEKPESMPAELIQSVPLSEQDETRYLKALATWRKADETVDQLEDTITNAYSDLSDLSQKPTSHMDAADLYRNYGIEAYNTQERGSKGRPIVAIWHEDSGTHIKLDADVHSFRNEVIRMGRFYLAPDHDGMVDTAEQKAVFELPDDSPVGQMNTDIEPQPEKAVEEKPAEKPKKEKKTKAVVDGAAAKPKRASRKKKTDEPTADDLGSVEAGE